MSGVATPIWERSPLRDVRAVTGTATFTDGQPDLWGGLSARLIPAAREGGVWRRIGYHVMPSLSCRGR